MDLSTVQRAYSRLQKLRIAVDQQERQLQNAVSVFLEERRGEQSASRVMGVSPAYAHDIRHGRRKISLTVMERLERLA